MKSFTEQLDELEREVSKIVEYNSTPGYKDDYMLMSDWIDDNPQMILELVKRFNAMRKVIENTCNTLDNKTAHIPCTASVYELTDEDFGYLMSIRDDTYEALAAADAPLEDE